MNRMKRILFTSAAVVVWSFVTQAEAQTPLGSDFTYQGVLNEAGVPFDGTADFDFTLWDANVDGLQIGATFTLLDVMVTAGAFTVDLDFGVESFNGDNRWLEIAVNTTLLAPRQRITATPYALQTRGIVVNDAGEVGIGTATPERLLHIVGDGVLIEREGNAPFVALRNTFDGQIMALFGLDSTGPDTGVAFITDQNLQRVIRLTDGNMGVGVGAGANRLSVNGNADFTGNVGIGTNMPAEALHVAGGNILADREAATGSVTRSLVLGGARALELDPYAMIQFQNYDQDNGLFDYIGAEILSYNDGEVDAGDLRFFTNDGGDSDTAERMRINGEGNVGIGTTTPATAFVGDGSGLTGLPSIADNLGDHTATQNIKLNGHYLSGDGGNEGVFVNDNGRVGIGTNSPDDARLEVNATTSLGAIYLRASDIPSPFGDKDPTLKIDGSGYLTDGSVTGIEVDLTGATAGSKYAAIFLGGKVGIGTNSPATKLDVAGKVTANNLDVAGTVTATSFVGDGSGLTGLGLGGCCGVVLVKDSGFEFASVACPEGMTIIACGRSQTLPEGNNEVPAVSAMLGGEFGSVCPWDAFGATSYSFINNNDFVAIAAQCGCGG